MIEAIRAKAVRRTGTIAVVLAAAMAALAAGAFAAGEAVHVARQKWAFGGILGHFDDAQLQRGFKVYTEVCARCHSIKRLYFRNLAESGGPGFPEAAIKSLAATYQVDDVPDDTGKVGKRPALPSDAIPAPYKNEQEARYVQNGALPPDLSLIAKARGIEAGTPFYRVPDTMLRDVVTGYQEAGADYIYAYLTGYKEPPANEKLGDFMHYNTVFPGHQTAMANPFVAGDGLVKYDDDTPATVDNYARDVVAFLSWVADPRLEERKRMGLLVIGYLVLTALLLGLAKRRIWSSVH
jgi:ubiquinol-cytochrome c reductase cytochrome c1 subunit